MGGRGCRWKSLPQESKALDGLEIPYVPFVFELGDVKNA